MPRPTKKSKAKHAKGADTDTKEKAEKKEAGRAHPYANARPAKSERVEGSRPRSEKKRKETFFVKDVPEVEAGPSATPVFVRETKQRPAAARPVKAFKERPPSQAREGRPQKREERPAKYDRPTAPSVKPRSLKPEAPRIQPEASTSAVPAGPTPEEIAAMPKSKRPKQPFTPKQPPPGTALIITSSIEPLPSAEVLSKLRRLDLLNAGFDDITWLKDAPSLTWLNLNGNPVVKGWEVVGKLAELAVLNISNTGVEEMPISLRRLKALKAFVATGNPWKVLNEHVVGEWAELNSLILSHSPLLAKLPTTLSTLKHLAKLSLSHCPVLTTFSFPDLSPLPVLRDIKLNHCTHLDTLPSHINTWGTGPLADHKGRGHGLEVVDLGSCNLTYLTLAQTFLEAKTPWQSLRSLTVQQNPLAESHPDYAERLVAAQGSTLPKLQIVDAKRVVERKRKGEVMEKKARVPKVREVRMTGANGAVEGEMRQWGPAGDVEADEVPVVEASATATATVSGQKDKKARKAEALEQEPVLVEGRKKKKAKKAVAEDEAPARKLAATAAVQEPEAVPVPTPAPAPIAEVVETSSKSRTNANMKTSVLKVIDVAPAKRKTTNIAAEFAKKPEADSGLGVGGW